MPFLDDIYDGADSKVATVDFRRGYTLEPITR